MYIKRLFNDEIVFIQKHWDHKISSCVVGSTLNGMGGVDASQCRICIIIYIYIYIYIYKYI